MYLNNWTLKRSFKKVFCLNVCNKEPWVKIIKLFDKKGGDIKIFTFRDPHRILARTSRSDKLYSLGVEWKKVRNLGERVFLLPFLGLLNMTSLGKVDFCNIYVFIYHFFKIQRHDWNSIHLGSNFTVARVANFWSKFMINYIPWGIWGVKKKSGTSDTGILGAPCANSRIHLIRRIVLLFCNPEAFDLVLFICFCFFLLALYVYRWSMYLWSCFFFIESLLTIPQKWF